MAIKNLNILNFQNTTIFESKGNQILPTKFNVEYGCQLGSLYIYDFSLRRFGYTCVQPGGHFLVPYHKNYLLFSKKNSSELKWKGKWFNYSLRNIRIFRYCFYSFFKKVFYFVGMGFRFKRRKLRRYLVFYFGGASSFLLKKQYRIIWEMEENNYKFFTLSLLIPSLGHYNKLIKIIYDFKPVELYKGKGIRFSDQRIDRKVGKRGRF